MGMTHPGFGETVHLGARNHGANASIYSPWCGALYRVSVLCFGHVRTWTSCSLTGCLPPISLGLPQALLPCVSFSDLLSQNWESPSLGSGARGQVPMGTAGEEVFLVPLVGWSECKDFGKWHLAEVTVLIFPLRAIECLLRGGARPGIWSKSLPLPLTSCVPEHMAWSQRAVSMCYWI